MISPPSPLARPAPSSIFILSWRGGNGSDLSSYFSSRALLAGGKAQTCACLARTRGSTYPHLRSNSTTTAVRLQDGRCCIPGFGRAVNTVVDHHQRHSVALHWGWRALDYCERAPSPFSPPQSNTPRMPPVNSIKAPIEQLHLLWKALALRVVFSCCSRLALTRDDHEASSTHLTKSPLILSTLPRGSLFLLAS